MGWVISVSNPGIALRASSIFAISSSFVFADVHSAFGFRAMSMSARSTGIGSVGISALPIRVTACFISGNCLRSIFSANVVVLIIWDREVPCDILNSAAKSPSSRFGRNSPPNFENRNKLPKKITTINEMMPLLHTRLFSKIGR